MKEISLTGVGQYKHIFQNIKKDIWGKTFNFRKMRNVVGFTMRSLFVAGTFHYIKIKGQRASPRDAPIIIAAPHTSFYDSILVIVSGPSAVVAKAESGELTFFGSMKFIIYFFNRLNESCKSPKLLLIALRMGECLNFL